MNFRAGIQSIELLRPAELPKTIAFQSHEEALKWVKQIASLQPEATLRFREYLARFSDDSESFRLTDHQALERVAEVLYSRKMVIVVREERSHAGSPGSKTTGNPVAFPLSERAARQSTASSATRSSSTASSPTTPPDDPPTFDSRLDAVSQAAALVTAAKEEWPLCPE